MDRKLAAIEPGAEVRGTDGVLGVVEQRGDYGAEGMSDATHLRVRGPQGEHYRLPAALVADVTVENGRSVVLLDAPGAELARYSAADAAGMAGVYAARGETGDAGETVRVPLAAEELVAETRPVSGGTVRVHKRVEVTEQSVSVPVYHEEAIIEHISPDQYDANAPSDPDEVIIPIVEEQIVVEKRSVIKEYIRIRKTLVRQQQDVHDTVRREYVEIEEPTSMGGRGPVARDDAGTSERR